MQPQIELFRDDYRLREKVSGKARNIRVEVRPGGDVVLVYPRFVGRVEALAFLRARESWVRAKLAELEQREARIERPPPLCWDGSDRVPLRGAMLALQVEPARLRAPQVRFEDGGITVFGSAATLRNPPALQRVLTAGFKHQARLDARRYLEAEGERLGVRARSLRLNDAQTLWGSCNPTGTICLSWRLVMAPPEVFRYVAVHELCHLVHRNHSARYWKLVEKQMPEYEQHKRWLREHGAGLHLHLPAHAAVRVPRVQDAEERPARR
jgi:predicted metal-dependent hydrolase